MDTNVRDTSAAGTDTPDVALPSPPGRSARPPGWEPASVGGSVGGAGGWDIAEVDDAVVELIRTRPLEGVKARVVEIEVTPVDGGAAVRDPRGRLAVVSAGGYGPDGVAEPLAVEPGRLHDRGFWLQFLHGLRARGLRDVRLVVAGCYRGLPEAAAAIFPSAVWVRPEELDVLRESSSLDA